MIAELAFRTANGAGPELSGVCSYDGMGRLISITSRGANVTDEFHYDEEGKKTGVRTVPPRPGHEGMTTSVSIMFELTEEGYSLTGGGSVTTRYNDERIC